MQITMKTTVTGENGSPLAEGSTYTVSDAFGRAQIIADKAEAILDVAESGQEFDVKGKRNSVTGGNELSVADGSTVSIGARQPVLNGASAGTDSGWLPLAQAPERFAYQLDSGTTTTGFSVDISADGSTSLGQAFTGTWSSSTVAEITFPIMFSNPLAKFFRWTVMSGGPLSVTRGV